MKKQSGYTLIEIMIALLIGLIIVAATIAIYISTVRGSTDTIRSARLNHDLESAMSLMMNDIRRAGYWGGAIAGADSKTNPFTIGAANIQSPAAGCILYTYDADGDGVVDDPNEYYGFKLEGTNIRMRKSGATTAAAGCSNSDPNEWETMNIDSGNSRSEKIEIDTLTFNFNDASAPSKCKNVATVTSVNNSCAAAVAAATITLNSGDTVVETRQVTIALSGHITDEASVSKTLTSTVKVRNDRIFTQP
jgi:prepilin peptidase dependent protein B